MARGAPRVRARIRDLSERVEEAGYTKGAVVFASDRGPCNQRTLVTRSRQFTDDFGKEDGVHIAHYAAKEWMRRSRVLQAVRVVPAVGGALYGGVVYSGTGSSTPAPLGVGLADDGLGEPNVSGFSFLADEILLFTGRGPGLPNNDLAVIISDVDASGHTFYVTVHEKDADGNWVEVEEPWFCSRVKAKKDGYGSSLYIENVINGKSNYIWVYDNDAVAGTIDPDAYTTETTFAGGSNGTDPTHSQIATAWGTYFNNPSAVDVDVLMSAGYTNQDGALDEVAAKLIDIAANRLDCFAAIGVPKGKSVAEAIAWRNALTLGTQPFLGGFYYNWPKIKCTQTDTDVYAPVDGYAAAVMAYCDDVDSPWASPMGINRALVSAIGLEQELTYAEQSLLYEAEINPLIKEPGRMYFNGQRTAQAKRSSLSEIAVVRGLVSLIPGIKSFLQAFKGEKNNGFNRDRVESGIQAVLRPLVRAGTLEAADVQCDEENNPAATRAAGRMVTEGFVKATPTAEEISFSFVVVRTGAILASIG